MKLSLIIILVLLSQQFLFSQTKIEAFEKNKDAVVRIYTMQAPGAGNSYYYSTGSGFAVNEEGWIFTNHHVIEDALGLYVVGRTDTDVPDTSAAYVIWEDEDLDIAILRTDDLNLPMLKMTKDSKISQGDEVLIMGFPGSDLNDDEIKVTSGILSSNTEDSTLMTTAPINPGNSGGPAINYKGEVVGQVYAKLVGLNVESTGFLRNMEYLVKSLEDAKSNEIPLKRAIGIDNFEAYKQMCFADAEYIKINETEDSLKKMVHVDKAIDLMTKVLELEPSYAIARYYLVNYLFKKAELHCEFDTEMDEEKADRLIEEFQYNWEIARKDGSGEDYAKEINSNIEYKIYSLADADDIACYRWRDRVANYSNYAIASYIRRDEFENYIYYGSTPRHLRESLVNPTWEHSKYKKYDALINEIPLAVTINNYISVNGILGESNITSTVSNIEFEVEPFNELKFLLSIGFIANQIDESSLLVPSTSDRNLKYKDAESTPIKLGLFAYNMRARYNVTDVHNVMSRKWSFEYVSQMPGDGYGEVDSYSYFGLGGYDTSIDTDFAINFGHAVELFNSRVWLDLQFLLGFGEIDDLYQLGIGVGYRY